MLSRYDRGRGSSPPPINGGGTVAPCARIQVEDAQKAPPLADWIQAESAWGNCKHPGLATKNMKTKDAGRGTHLPDHDTSVPPLRLRLPHTRAERRRVHVPVRRVRGRRRLADDELVEREAVIRDLEEGGAGEAAPRAGEEPCAVAVQALVVELDVVLETSESQLAAACK